MLRLRPRLAAVPLGQPSPRHRAWAAVRRDHLSLAGSLLFLPGQARWLARSGSCCTTLGSSPACCGCRVRGASGQAVLRAVQHCMAVLLWDPMTGPQGRYRLCRDCVALLPVWPAVRLRVLVNPPLHGPLKLGSRGTGCVLVPRGGRVAPARNSQTLTSLVPESPKNAPGTATGQESRQSPLPCSDFFRG